MKITCRWLHQNLGYECRTVQTVDGSQALRVQTAHTWADGTPLTFYIIPSGDTIILTDDCDTLFHFHTQGLLETARSIHALREMVACTDTPISVEEDGEIMCMGNQQKAARMIADYLSAMCGIMHYERGILGVPREVADFAEEVELYLKAWKPKAKLQKNVKVRGISGHDYTFDFQMDDKLILAINPNPASVGAVMRKTGDVKMGSDLDSRELMVIVDDRGEDLFHQKAEEEIRIISALVKAVPFSNILKQVPTSTRQ